MYTWGMATNETDEKTNATYVRESVAFPGFHLLQLPDEVYAIAAVAPEADGTVDGLVEIPNGDVSPWWELARFWDETGEPITVRLFENICGRVAVRCAADMAEIEAAR